MQRAIELAAVLLAILTLVPALAHALEYPGKMRLAKDAYFAIQRVYYPGFTFAGIGEPLSILAALALLVITPLAGTTWWWILAALVALVGMQGVYWLFTHPVNKFWLEGEHMGSAGSRFFSVGSSGGSDPTRDGNAVDWTRLRDRWELSHVARAVLALIAVICLLVAIQQR